MILRSLSACSNSLRSFISKSQILQPLTPTSLLPKNNSNQQLNLIRLAPVLGRNSRRFLISARFSFLRLLFLLCEREKIRELQPQTCRGGMDSFFHQQQTRMGFVQRKIIDKAKFQRESHMQGNQLMNLRLLTRPCGPFPFYSTQRPHNFIKKWVISSLQLGHRLNKINDHYQIFSPLETVIFLRLLQVDQNMQQPGLCISYPVNSILLTIIIYFDISPMRRNLLGISLVLLLLAAAFCAEQIDIAPHSQSSKAVNAQHGARKLQNQQDSGSTVGNSFQSSTNDVIANHETSGQKLHFGSDTAKPKEEFQVLSYEELMAQGEEAYKKQIAEAQAKAKQAGNTEAPAAEANPTTPSTTTQTTNPPPTQKPEVKPPPPPPAPKILLGEINKPIIGKGFKEDSGVSYQRIQVTTLDSKYLFFSLSLAQKDKWQQVKMKLSIEGSESVIKSCEDTASDSCFLSKDLVRQNSVLFVHIQCQDDCTYNLNAHWSDLEHLNPGDDVIFMFGANTSQLYHFELKDDRKFEQIRIHLAPRTTKRPFDNIKIYGKYGAENVAPTPQDHDFRSINLWQDGQGLFFTKKSLKDRRFTLLIVGQSETTYRLTCELIETTTHQIDNQQHIYEYLDAGSSKKFKINFDTKKFDEFSLRFSTLSGELDVTYYTDEDLKHPYGMEPFEYMKDSQHIFYASQIAHLVKGGIYINVVTDKRDATFTIKFVGRKQAESIELNEHVYGFIPILKTKFAHFNFMRWFEEAEIKTNVKFTVYMIEVVGKVVPEFRVCHSTISACTNEDTYKDHTKLIPFKPHSDVSQKQIYDLEIEQGDLKTINSAEEEAIIVVRLTGTTTDKDNAYSLAALEFLNYNKILYLREGRPFEDKLNEGEMKIYKYINSDPNVQEIRIHLNEIAGHVQLNGQIKHEDITKSTVVSAESNTIRFTHDLNQPILVGVSAQTRAIFGISMQIIHKSELTEGASVISISEDLGYTVKIQPGTFTFFEVTPIFYEFNFTYVSSQSVIACVVNPLDNSCIDPNGKDQTHRLAVKGEITKAKLTNRKVRVKITNPFSDSVAEVQVIFHSRNFQHCDDKKIGTVYNTVAKDGSCFSYILTDDHYKTLDIYVSKREFASLTYSVLLCGNSIQGANTMHTLHLTPDVISAMCKSSVEAKRVSIIWSVATKSLNKQDDKQVKVDFLAQYAGDIILLPEGVSYNMILPAQEGQLLHKFAFNLINKKKTKVMIDQIRGRYHAYAKIVNEPEKEKTIISEINYQFTSSKTLDYSQEPVIIITEEDIKNAGCVDCTIVVAIFSLDNNGRELEFEIEFVQKYEALHENTAVNGYLEAGSIAYYFYEARQDYETTLLFLISDHNQQCANMYLGLAETTGPTLHISKSIGGNELIYRHFAGQRKYFLAVEARKLCDYTLSVLTIDSSIHKLEIGKQNMIKLPKDRVKYFSFEHKTNDPFKIITLTKYGEVKLYLNQSFLQPDRKTFSTKELELSEFAYVSEHSNTLSIDQKSPHFCTKCNYFLGIKALTNTESTIYLTSLQTIIPIVPGKILTDYLSHKGSYTLASYNRIERTKIQVTVHQGEIEISAIYKESRNVANFAAKEQLQSMTVDLLNFSPPKHYIPQADQFLGSKKSSTVVEVQRIPLNLIITAKSDKTSYSLEMISLDKNEISGGLVSYQSIIAGEPNRIELSNTKVLCLNGFLRESNEEIIISTNSDNQKKLSTLVIQAKLNQVKAEITKSIFKNVLSLSFKLPPPVTFESASLELCIKLATPEQPKIKQTPSDKLSAEDTESQQDEEIKLSAVVSQTNSVNILPSDTETQVKGSTTFVVHSEGEFLLDVFECKGEAKINYGNSLQNIEKSKLKMLDVVGMSEQRHAVKIIQNETTFVQVKSDHSIVRWFPINFETDQGTGYLKYEIGDLKYTSHFKYLSIEFQPIQTMKPSKAKINDIEYVLFFSSSHEQIELASHCDAVDTNNVEMVSLGSHVISKTQQKEYISYQMNKQVLEKRFSTSENIYFSIIAKMSIQVPVKVDQDSRYSSSSDEHEHYRFIYSRQQIPLESFKQNEIESIPYSYLALIVVSIVGILILFTYIFTRKIVPLIARLKNSNLVEEEPQNNEHRDDFEVPASSDRNQRQPGTAIETEDRMGK